MKRHTQASKASDTPGLGRTILTVGVDESPPPPLCFGVPDSLDYKGFEVDLLKVIALKLGVELCCQSVLRSVAFDELQGGRLDMICTAVAITPQRRKLVDFSDPYFETDLAMIVHRDSPIQCVHDLGGRRVGVRIATVAEEFVHGHCQPSIVRTFNLNVDAYQALRDQQIDAVIDDRPIGVFFAHFMEGLSVAPPLPGTGFQYGIVFAKGNDLLRGTVNHALATLRADGTMQHLHRRWFDEGGAQ